ncbi:hypothetical protein D9758_007495 [Tetrapyrgos nigripes]|uniref:Uncharacterized protein n=1 Tax=Tetrapyrgos nigripes TaxID=182062 RepID=A0A8H5LHS2_9AGAR|nr:hypothetical protein D9758_007495 [Tetrapyrgos nigripes]
MTLFPATFPQAIPAPNANANVNTTITTPRRSQRPKKPSVQHNSASQWAQSQSQRASTNKDKPKTKKVSSERAHKNAKKSTTSQFVAWSVGSGLGFNAQKKLSGGGSGDGKLLKSNLTLSMAMMSLQTGTSTGMRTRTRMGGVSKSNLNESASNVRSKSTLRPTPCSRLLKSNLTTAMALLTMKSDSHVSNDDTALRFTTMDMDKEVGGDTDVEGEEGDGDVTMGSASTFTSIPTPTATSTPTARDVRPTPAARPYPYLYPINRQPLHGLRVPSMIRTRRRTSVNLGLCLTSMAGLGL